MLGDGSLTFQEFAMGELLPLAAVQEAVLEFLQGREDAAVYGAQAVNAYVDQPRMTQDVDLLSTRAEALAEQLRKYLSERFAIAVRVRVVADGVGYRLYQLRKPKNRHLVDIRNVQELPSCSLLRQVLVLAPPELIGYKVVSMTRRPRTPKGLTDAADLRRLLLAFPELKSEEGAVHSALQAMSAPKEAFEAWRELVAEELLPDDEDAGF